MRKFLFLLLMLFPMAGNAFDFEVDGIYYTITSIDDLTVEVANATIMQDGTYRSAYRGDIVIPSTVTYQSITFSVTRIGDFAFCYYRSNGGSTSAGGNDYLTSVTIPESVLEMGDAPFFGCSALKSVVLPNNFTEYGSSLFWACRNLENVTLGDKLQVIGYACFKDCSSLSSIDLPISINCIKSEAFSGCSRISEFNLPPGVTEIEDDVFKNCTSLSSIDLTHITTIGQSAFEGCSALEEVIIPVGLTSLGDHSFKDCSNLKQISFPSTLTTFGNETFASCPKLEEIKSKIVNPFLYYPNESCFSTITYLTAKLFVPEELSSLYREAPTWKKFVNIIEDGEEEPSQIPQCATPIIIFENGIIRFECDTEGVVFISDVTCEDVNRYYESCITLTKQYRVSVYATKDGYNNSETVIKDIDISGLNGDIDGDGNITISDVTELIDILLQGNR